MHNRIEKILYWLPRGLGILFILFISVFALDAFNDGLTWEAVLSFLIHLIPVYILIIVLVLAWRWEWTSAIFYPLMAIVYIFRTSSFPFSVYGIITGPLFLLAILFTAHQFYIKKPAK